MLIGSQNIQGSLSKKLQLDNIVKIVQQFDIFCLQETWAIKDQTIKPPKGYQMYRSDRKKGKSKKGSGGVAVLVKNNIHKFCVKIDSKSSDFLWIKIQRDSFGLSFDLYIACCYIPPSNSGRNFKNYYEILTEETAIYSGLGEVLILGDLNSRIGIRVEEHIPDSDFLQDEQHENGILQDQNESSSFYFTPRAAMDTTINTNGRKLLSFTNNSHLVILNGRTAGDTVGRFTCNKYNGSSTVDYAIVSRNLKTHVQYFTVEEPNWYSDHCLIKLRIHVNENARYKHQNNVATNGYQCDEIYKYVWDEAGAKLFKEMVNSEDTKQKINSFMTESCNDVNLATNSLHGIILNIAEKCLKKVKITKKKKFSAKRMVEKESFGLKGIKSIFSQSKKLFANNPFNMDARRAFLIAKKRYKKVVYKINQLSKQNKINNIESLKNLDQREFWKKLRSFIKPDQDDGLAITPENWYSYFSGLLNPECTKRPTQFEIFIKEALPTLENCAQNNDFLDENITEAEVMSSVKSLKNGSASSDLIFSEMIKASAPALCKPLVKVFNLILDTKIYPDLWHFSNITAIFKSGNINDPSCYRGIAVGSCMSKVLTKIIVERIDSYMTQENLYNNNQLGFRKKFRTEDNIFIIYSAINKYVLGKQNNRKQKQLFLAFVDFQKFYDMINRDMLFYKLLKYNITGKVYHFIKSIYSACNFRIKCKEGLYKKHIKSTVGLKQGCGLSPILSNIYQNDIHDCISNNNDPIELNGQKISSLSWADDLVLMATSATGLQKGLNNIAEYCDKWNLTVNTIKSKCMCISNKRVMQLPIFLYKNVELENVSEFRYLGILIHKSGKLKHSILDRIKKAERAIFLIKQAFQDSNGYATLNLAVTLFEKQIMPILCYASPIWGVPNNTNYFYIEGIEEADNIKNKLNIILGSNSYKSAKRVGVKKQGLNRKILVEASSFESKLNILSTFIARNDSFSVSDYDIEYDSFSYEKVQTSFCKYMLQIPKNCNNFAIRAELGRFPICLNIWKHVIKYWQRLQTKSGNINLDSAFLEMKTIQSNWTEGITKIIKTSGFAYIANDPKLAQPLFHKQIFMRLKDQYLQKFIQLADDAKSKSLTLLKDLKETYQMSNYLKLKQDVKNLSKLRTNTSILAISEKFNRTDANFACPFCKETETIEHFILNCRKYSSERNTFITEVKTFIKNFAHLEKKEQLAIILNCTSSKCKTSDLNNLSKSIMTFINSIYKIREAV